MPKSVALPAAKYTPSETDKALGSFYVLLSDAIEKGEWQDVAISLYYLKRKMKGNKTLTNRARRLVNGLIIKCLDSMQDEQAEEDINEFNLFLTHAISLRGYLSVPSPLSNEGVSLTLEGRETPFPSDVAYLLITLIDNQHKLNSDQFGLILMAVWHDISENTTSEFLQRYLSWEQQNITAAQSLRSNKEFSERLETILSHSAFSLSLSHDRLKVVLIEAYKNYFESVLAIYCKKTGLDARELKNPSQIDGLIEMLRDADYIPAMSPVLKHYMGLLGSDGKIISRQKFESLLDGFVRMEGVLEKPETSVDNSRTKLLNLVGKLASLARFRTQVQVDLQESRLNALQAAVASAFHAQAKKYMTSKKEESITTVIQAYALLKLDTKQALDALVISTGKKQLLKGVKSKKIEDAYIADNKELSLLILFYRRIVKAVQSSEAFKAIEPSWLENFEMGLSKYVMSLVIDGTTLSQAAELTTDLEKLVSQALGAQNAYKDAHAAKSPFKVKFKTLVSSAASFLKRALEKHDEVARSGAEDSVGISTRKASHCSGEGDLPMNELSTGASTDAAPSSSSAESRKEKKTRPAKSAAEAKKPLKENRKKIIRLSGSSEEELSEPEVVKANLKPVERCILLDEASDEPTRAKKVAPKKKKKAKTKPSVRNGAVASSRGNAGKEHDKSRPKSNIPPSKPVAPVIKEPQGPLGISDEEKNELYLKTAGQMVHVTSRFGMYVPPHDNNEGFSLNKRVSGLHSFTVGAPNVVSQQGLVNALAEATHQMNGERATLQTPSTVTGSAKRRKTKGSKSSKRPKLRTKETESLESTSIADRETGSISVRVDANKRKNKSAPARPQASAARPHQARAANKPQAKVAKITPASDLEGAANRPEVRLPLEIDASSEYPSTNAETAGRVIKKASAFTKLPTGAELSPAVTSETLGPETSAKEPVRTVVAKPVPRRLVHSGDDTLMGLQVVREVLPEAPTTRLVPVSIEPGSSNSASVPVAPTVTGQPTRLTGMTASKPVSVATNAGKRVAIDPDVRPPVQVSSNDRKKLKLAARIEQQAREAMKKALMLRQSVLSAQQSAVVGDDSDDDLPSVDAVHRVAASALADPRGMSTSDRGESVGASASALYQRTQEITDEGALQQNMSPSLARPNERPRTPSYDVTDAARNHYDRSRDPRSKDSQPRDESEGQQPKGYFVGYRGDSRGPTYHQANPYYNNVRRNDYRSDDSRRGDFRREDYRRDDFRRDDYRRDDYRRDDYRRDDYRRDDYRRDDYRRDLREGRPRFDERYRGRVRQQRPADSRDRDSDRGSQYRYSKW